MKLLLATIALAVTYPAYTQAGSILTYDTVSTGATPSGSPPWLTVEFENAGSGNVEVILTNHLQSATEFISQVAFNYSATAPALGGLAILSSTSSPTAGLSVSLDTSNNITHGWGPAGQFDWGFQFQTSNGSGRFTMGDTLTILLHNTNGSLDASDFLLTNDKGIYSDAHVQGIGGDDSGKITPTLSPAPEPSSLVLAGLGMGATGLSLLLHRRQKNRQTRQ
jgi:hypothetical protein